MKICSLFVLTVFLFLSCKEPLNKKIESKPETILKVSVPHSLNGCYEMTISGDTALMKIMQNNDFLTGTLMYKRKGKDSNKGTVVLTKTNNRAEGYYTFQSEGKTSVRQMVFKIEKNSFAEGYGDIEMKKDTAIFKYSHALNFEEKHVFNHVICK
jgi:hypothetical protein